MKQSNKNSAERRAVVRPVFIRCTLAILLVGAIPLFGHHSPPPEPSPTPTAERPADEREQDPSDSEHRQASTAIVGDFASQAPAAIKQRVAQGRVGTKRSVSNGWPAKAAASSGTHARAVSTFSPLDELATFSDYAKLIDGTSLADEFLDGVHLDGQRMRGLSAEQKVHLIMALDRADPHGNRMALLSAKLAREYEGAFRLPLQNASLAASRWELPKLGFGRRSISPLRSEQLQRLLPYFADGRYGSPFDLYGEWFSRSPHETAVELVDTSFEKAVEGQVARWSRFEQEEFLNVLYARSAADYESLRFDPIFQQYRQYPKSLSGLKRFSVRPQKAVKSSRFNKLFRVLKSLP